MLEDDIVRDSMKIFVNSILQKIDGNELKQNRDYYVEEGATETITIKQEGEEILEGDEELRVEKLINDYHENNPLGPLNFFKNKVKIPFSFTFTQKGNGSKAIRVATLFVGSEICNIKLNNILVGVGEDRSIKIAKYKAAAEGLQRIKMKYGEDILKTKDQRKQKAFNEIKEELASDEEKGLNYDIYLDEVYDMVKLLFEELDNSKGDSHTIQTKLEVFLIKYERSLIPINDIAFIQKFIAKIFYFNQTISIHFNNPMLVGSFRDDCCNIKHKVIDLLFTHHLSEEEMMECTDNLIKNFKHALKDLYSIFNSDIFINIRNKINEKNMDLEIIFKDRDYSFNLIIRSLDEENKDFAQFFKYLPSHNEKIYSKVKNFQNFNIMKRLLRSWRLFFIYILGENSILFL